MSGDRNVARDNTRAHVFYVARCRTCGDCPDGDGAEFSATEQEAFDWPVANDIDWWLSPDGFLYCDTCRPEDSWPKDADVV